jgi:hypothetical protein
MEVKIPGMLPKARAKLIGSIAAIRIYSKQGDKLWLESAPIS